MRAPLRLSLVLWLALAPALATATVTTTASSASYAGNGVVVAFAVPFKYLATSDLLVTSTTNGVTTTLTLTTHYTVSAPGDTGTVTMVTAPATGATLAITRRVPQTQLTSFASNGRFDAARHERAYDRLTLQAQDEAREREAVAARATGLETRTAALESSVTALRTATATWDPASVASGACTATTVTVTGVALGHLARASFGLAVPAGVTLTADVTAANAVAVKLCNLSGGAVDLASGTVRAVAEAY